MRTFIAIEIPEQIRRKLGEIQHGLKEAAVDASWPRMEGIHLTLKFLGEIPESQVIEIMQAIATAAAGIGRFRIGVEGTGAFPNARNARVIWAGVSGDLETLARLQTGIEDSLGRIGIERENRPFTPHLTLARIKFIRSRESLLAALDRVKGISLPAFDVNAVSLMKSELRRTGAEYTQIAKVELK